MNESISNVFFVAVKAKLFTKPIFCPSEYSIQLKFSLYKFYF